MITGGCSRRRTAFSGAESAYAEVAPGSFSWVSGEDDLTHYETMPGWGLCFCRRCGGTLCSTASGEVHGVTLGTVGSHWRARTPVPGGSTRSMKITFGTARG